MIITYISYVHQITGSFFLLYTLSYAVAYVLYEIKILEALTWKLVAIYRFLKPAAVMVWCIQLLTTLILEEGFWAHMSTLALNSYYTFIIKDHFGDDPRNKKPSKISSLIKSLGHRLVIVPN